MESWGITRETFSVVLNVQVAFDRCYVVGRIANRNFRPFSNNSAKGLLIRSERSTSCDVMRLCNNRPFPSCCEPHYESEAKCKSFSYKN